MNAIIFVSKTLIDLYILSYVLRLVLQWVRADFYNPFSQFIMRITNPLVLPGRKLLPAVGRIDTATAVAILLLEILAVVFLYWLITGALPSRPGEVLLYAALRTIVAFINLYFFAIIIRVIQSWIAPGTHNPVTAVIWSITEPLMAPVRRLIPDIGGLDLSPLFVIIGLQALRMLIPLPPGLL
ncbi:MAG: YggT family protein [Gammaproteobacteria bacterium]|nr:YggT family protein [Gammaproteobacteria bacterium]